MGELPKLALSIRQPWAWAIIHAGKDIENRSWQAISRGAMAAGRIAIHAAKGMTRDEYESAAEFMKRLGVVCPLPFQLDRGGIIGSVTITDFVKDSDSPWFFGPRGIVLADAKPCEPQPCLGSLGFFEWVSTMADDLDQPKPWMASWPAQAERKQGAQIAPQPLSLFADT
jgi:hypothetical protein